MDQAKVAYFVEKFDACDPEELAELVGRRHDLADETIEALDQVLARKGLSASILASHSTMPGKADHDDVDLAAEQTVSSRVLWRGGVAAACNFMVAMTFMAPVQILLKSANIGAVWAGLAVVAAGYAGYRVGRSITKDICADGESSITTKKKKLWWFLPRCGQYFSWFLLVRRYC